MSEPLLAAFDIGGTKTLVSLVRGRELVCERGFASDPSAPPEVCLDRCAALLADLIPECGERPDALGMSLPGMVDSETGTLLYAPFSGWRDVPFTELARERTGIRTVAAENDVNACALGERDFASDPCRDFLWVTVSTGCGGAVVANGQLVRGGRFCAGEIGHLKVEYERPRRCPCGQWGCLEAEASGTAMGALLAETAERDTALRAAMGERPASAETLCAMTREGVPGAATLFEHCAVRLGRALAAACNLLNPERIYLGGGVMKSFDLFAPLVQAAIRELAIGSCAETELRYTAMGYHAGVFGAAATARQLLR